MDKLQGVLDLECNGDDVNETVSELNKNGFYIDFGYKNTIRYKKCDMIIICRLSFTSIIYMRCYGPYKFALAFYHGLHRDLILIEIQRIELPILMALVYRKNKYTNENSCFIGMLPKELLILIKNLIIPKTIYMQIYTAPISRPSLISTMENIIL
jgi:hypothetical protein